MTEKAVRAFLTCWLKQQTKGKVHPLLIHKPQSDEEVSESQQADIRDRQVWVAETGAMEWQDIPNKADDDRGNEEMGEEQVKVQDESGQDNGVGVNGVEIESDGGQGQDGGDVDAVASNKGIPGTKECGDIKIPMAEVPPVPLR